MKLNTTTEKLDIDIALLKSKQSKELILLKDQFHLTYDSLKPINLIKSLFHEVADSPEIKSNIVNNIIGLSTGYITKKLLFGASHNPITKLIGTLFQFGVTNVISKHSESIKSTGGRLLHNFIKFKD
jgi:hypothetical protein